MSDAGEERAEVLRDGVPYVRGWNEARDAARELADELRALGLADDFAYLQGDVNAFGKGFVRLGLVMGDAARELARTLELGVVMEISNLPCAEEPKQADRSMPGT